MTAKRDFKRRVRQRQARTGESYVTARRHLMASRPDKGSEAEPDGPVAERDGPDTEGTDGPDTEGTDSPDTSGPGSPDTEGPDSPDTEGPDGADTDGPDTGGPDSPDSPDSPDMEGPDTDGPDSPDENPPQDPPKVSVVELLDVSAEARQVGLLCPITMFPTLAARIEPFRALRQLREVLIAMVGDPDPALRRISDLALTGQSTAGSPRRVVSATAIHRFIARAGAGLGGVFEDGSMLAFPIADGERVVSIIATLASRDTSLMLSSVVDLLEDPLGPDGVPYQVVTTLSPLLYVVHDGRRHAVLRGQFVIGRDRKACDLALRDGQVSRRHAVVIRRSGAYYLKDLGSTHGIVFKGMRIDNKRIDEGDAFQIGDQEIRFTFKVE